MTANRSGTTSRPCSPCGSACRSGPRTATWPASAVAAPHTHGRQAPRACDFAALNLAGLCAVMPYAHDLAWAGDSTFLPKSGRQLPGVGWRRHGGAGRVAWGQPQELLSVLDLEEHYSHSCPRVPAACEGRARRSPGPLWAEVAVMPGCGTRPWPWRPAPTSGSSWGTATTSVRPWSRGCGNGTCTS